MAVEVAPGFEEPSKGSLRTAFDVYHKAATVPEQGPIGGKVRKSKSKLRDGQVRGYRAFRRSR